MDAILEARAEQLAKEFAHQHHTAEELNGLIRLMMKTALERMLNTELDVHLGRRAAPAALAAAEGQEASASGEEVAAATKASKPIFVACIDGLSGFAEAVHAASRVCPTAIIAAIANRAH